MTQIEALRLARPYIETALDEAIGRVAANEKWPERQAEYQFVVDRITAELAQIDQAIKGRQK